MTDRIAACLSSKRMDWATPRALFDEYDRAYRFDLDAAAEWHNTKCQHWIGPPGVLTDCWAQGNATECVGEDALHGKPWPGRRVWLNPPYGRGLGLWYARVAAMLAVGAIDLCAMLVPARTDTAYFHHFVWDKTVRRPRPLVQRLDFLQGRVRFEGADQVLAPAGGERDHLVDLPRPVVLRAAGHRQQVAVGASAVDRQAERGELAAAERDPDERRDDALRDRVDVGEVVGGVVAVVALEHELSVAEHDEVRRLRVARVACDCVRERLDHAWSCVSSTTLPNGSLHMNLGRPTISVGVRVSIPAASIRSRSSARPSSRAMQKWAFGGGPSPVCIRCSSRSPPRSNQTSWPGSSFGGTGFSGRPSRPP
jgi:site-specific DNA-methyltransferase (adenine-specific)